MNQMNSHDLSLKILWNPIGEAIGAIAPWIQMGLDLGWLMS